jgi:hypothetical protein
LKGCQIISLPGIPTCLDSALIEIYIKYYRDLHIQTQFLLINSNKTELNIINMSETFLLLPEMLTVFIVTVFLDYLPRICPSISFKDDLYVAGWYLRVNFGNLPSCILSTCSLSETFKKTNSINIRQFRAELLHAHMQSHGHIRRSLHVSWGSE